MLLMMRVMMIIMTLAGSMAFVPTIGYYRCSNIKSCVNDGKGFGGGEATRDPRPTNYDLNDPKAKQTAIHKADSFAEYLAKRSKTNTHGAATGQSVVLDKVSTKSGIVKNAESYADYMAKRKAVYMKKYDKE